MRRPFLFMTFLGIALATQATAQSPVLLKDINTKPIPNPSSSPYGYSHNLSTPWDNNKFARIGSTLIFGADDGTHGTELWKSLPNLNTASMIKEIFPRPFGSWPKYFTNFGNKVLFFANNGTGGHAPWITDGTPAGTFMLKDCSIRTPSNPAPSPVVMGGKCYWCSYNGYTYDIWASDGTKACPIKIFPGFKSSWLYPVAVGSKIVFCGHLAGKGHEPWVTDGTTAGTKMLLDVQPGKSSGYLNYPVALGNKCYFFSNPGTYTLYETNGTPKGTKVIQGGFSDAWKAAIPLGNKIIFLGATSAHGYEPWITDGTPEGTKILKDIKPGTGSGYFKNPVVFNNKVYFQAYTATGSSLSIWVTDGTTAGTKVVSSKSGSFDYPTVAGGNIFFRGSYAAGTNHGRELWKTDGTDAGTKEVKDIYPGTSSSDPSYLTEVIGNKVVFAATDKLHGMELWISDGTTAGTRMLQDIFVSGTMASHPKGFIGVSGLTYFTANDGVHVPGLWKTSGITPGTVMIKGLFLFPGLYPLSYSKMYSWRHDGTWKPTALGKTLFFHGYTLKTGDELWRTDGTEAGTMMVKDIYPGPKSSLSLTKQFCIMGNHLYFFADDGTGNTLWKTDGTAGGTTKVGSACSQWNHPFPYAGKIFFEGYTSGTGFEPWVTDGTASGTKILKDIEPGSRSGHFIEPVAMEGKVYFRAYNPKNFAYALWVTDGSTPGTKVVYSLRKFPPDFNLTVMGNRIFFEGFDPTHGKEPWVSDGTPSGTKLLKDVKPGWGDGRFSYPCVVGNTLYFQSSNSTRGYELWKTDGTAAGTVMVKDIHPGPGSSHPSNIIAVGTRRVIFNADDGIHGTELWESDGTAAGTVMLRDIYPGASSSNSTDMILSGGRVLFCADDQVHGEEPWTWFPGATAQSFGFGTSDDYAFTATDPVLGGKTLITLSGMKWGQAAVLLFADPTHTPSPFGNGWLYFDPSIVYTAAFLSAGPGSSLSLAVPDSTALVGGKVAAQAFVFPTPNSPYFLDLTCGVLLTFGR